MCIGIIIAVYSEIGSLCLQKSIAEHLKVDEIVYTVYMQTAFSPLGVQTGLFGNS